MKNYSRNLAKWSLLILFLIVGEQIFAQSTITGVVLDGGANNETLIGGNVMVKGKNVGTVTNIDGKYSIKASPNDVLVFSYTGMDKQEIAVGNKTEINVTLMPNSKQLDEVVAIGYGSVKKSDLTGSVAVVSAKDMTKNPSSSAAQALQGKAPGVLVTQSGAPGGDATIRVRGVGSISNDPNPIYIVDGVRVGGISGIQPQDIESLQVLKDASATAIYGADGSNGVIIVTTKRGKSGKIQVNFNSYLSSTLAPKQYDVMDADQYSAFYTGVHGARPEYQESFRSRYYGKDWQKGTNWQDLVYKTGMAQNYNLSLGGGSENSNFNVSMGYNKEDGTIIKNFAERFSLRANSDFKLNKYVKIGENLSVNRSTKETPITLQHSIWDIDASPLMRVDNPNLKGGFESPLTNYYEAADGSLTSIMPDGYLTSQPTYKNTLANDKPNPLASASLGEDRTYATSIMASVYAQIDFTDWLMFKTTPSYEVINSRNKNWSPDFEAVNALGNARLTEEYSEVATLTLQNQLQFKKLFFDVHNVQATAVMESRQEQSNKLNAVDLGFNYEVLNTMSNGGSAVGGTSNGGSTNDTRWLSYLGRVMYDFSGKYFLTASIRSDGVSKFAPGFKRGEFYSGSLAWKVTEDFLKDIEQLDFLKLRFGWGQTGNSNIGEGNFQYIDVIDGTHEFSPVFGDNQTTAEAQYVLNTMAATSIHWETAEMFNIGADLSLFNSRLQFSGEYYIKNNNGLLVKTPASMVFGRLDSNPWFNIADVQNRGVELTLQWRDNVGDFEYGLSSNFTTIKNQVDYIPTSYIINKDGTNITMEGHSIGGLYGYVADGIIQANSDYYSGAPDPVTGIYTAASGYKFAYQAAAASGPPQPGDIKYKDLNGDGVITNLDKTIIGKTVPSLNYTIGFDCSYKNFDLNIFLFGVSDFSIYNAQRASLSSMTEKNVDKNKLVDFANNHWTAENKSTTHVRVDASNTNLNDQISSFWIEDGSFLRVKDLQLGYKLSNRVLKSLGLQSLRLYVSASNIYNFTKYKGRDPEPFVSSTPNGSGIDNGQYEIPRQYTGGLQITF